MTAQSAYFVGPDTATLAPCCCGEHKHRLFLQSSRGNKRCLLGEAAIYYLFHFVAELKGAFPSDVGRE